LQGASRKGLKAQFPFDGYSERSESHEIVASLRSSQ
jgi:hypothetical protein